MATSRRGPESGTEGSKEGAETSDALRTASGEEPTLEALRDEASELEVEGRSSMNKDELASAVAEARTASENAEWPATRKDGNPFNVGGKKK